LPSSHNVYVAFGAQYIRRYTQTANDIYWAPNVQKEQFSVMS